MRVFISEDFPPRDGGLCTWAFHLASSLHELEGEMLVMTRSFSPHNRVLDRRLDFPVWRMVGYDWRRYGHLYVAYYLLRFLLTRGQRPIVYATRWKEGLVPSLLAPLTGLKVIIGAHGNDIIRKRNAYRRWLIRLAFRQAHFGVAVSRYTQRALLKLGIPQEKIVFIPNGVNASLFQPGQKSPSLIRRYGIQGQKVLLTLARLVARKGQDEVIKTLPQILRRVPQAVYLVVGRGRYERELKSLTRSLNLQDKVIFAGYVPQEEIVEHYQLADVYIMPSREIESRGDVEGFGITFLEANACGIPVIGGRSGGISDAVVDGQTGLLVDPEDGDHIAEAVIRLLTDEVYARQLGQQGRQRIIEELQWRRIAQRFLKLERSVT
jgi:phosphatidylinositol alpha-1,6-mannosyltransferase